MGPDEGAGAGAGAGGEGAAGGSGKATRASVRAQVRADAARASGRYAEERVAYAIAQGCTTKLLLVERVIARLSLAGLAYALPALAACTGHRETAVTDGAPTLEMLVANDPETLDPRYVTDAIGMRTTRLIHAGLTRTDPSSLRPMPYLAESFRWDSPLILDVTLRKDLRFHSGAPFTAEDVVATLTAFGSPAVASRHAATVEPISSAVAVGPYELTITLRRPHASLLADFDLPILRHDQAESPPDPTGATLDGLGPFEIERTERGEVLLRPAHYGAMPENRDRSPARSLPLHRVALRTVHDENARALRLYSGRADIVQSGISPTLLPALEGTSGLTLATTPGANLTYIVCRVDKGPLAHVDLRRAISLAIDRKTITSALFSGRATPASSLLPEGHWAAPVERSPVSFDPAGARSVVATLPDPPVRLTLLTSTDRLRITVARTIAEELGEVGLDVEVVPLELGTLLARLNAGEFDLASLQLPELTEPNVLRVFLHSAYVPPNGSNRGRVTDREVDQWLEKGDGAMDEAARADAYGHLEARIQDQLFIIPLWHEDQVAVVSETAREYRPSPEGRWLGLVEVR